MTPNHYLALHIPSHLEVLVKKILDENNHITAKIHQALRFFEKIYLRETIISQIDNQANSVDQSLLKPISLPLRVYLDGTDIVTYWDSMELLPPPFFISDMNFYKRKPNEEEKSITFNSGLISLSRMSSGERQMLYSFSYVLYHLVNIQSIIDDENRVPYNHINLIFDEAELYYHPEYQRKFLSMLLNCLAWSSANGRNFDSISILIATHSPFLLSDILRQNVLYLKEGEPFFEERQQTFGANLYDLMKNSFFLDENAMGEKAAEIIGELIKKVNNKQPINKNELELVGDVLIRDYLQPYVTN